MIIKVISLQTAESRRIAISHILKKNDLQFDFVDAIDGREMKAKEYYPLSSNPNYFFNRRSMLTPAEVGCRLSHKVAISDFLDVNSGGWLMILEDDIQFKEGFLELLNGIDKLAVEDPMIIHFGGQEGILCKNRVLKKIDKEFKSLGLSKVNKYTLRWLYRTCGYVLNVEAAKELHELHNTCTFVADDWGFILKKTRIKMIHYLDCVTHPLDLSDSSIENERQSA